MLDSSSNLQDPTVIKRLNKGDTDALRQVYVEYYSQLLRYGCSIEPDEGLVHDEIQDLFVWLIRNPDQLIGIRNVKTYLFKSLRPNIRSKVKKIRENRIKAEAFYPTDGEDTNHDAYWEEDEIREKQIFEIRKRIAQLPSRQREVVFLRFYENLNNDEIAEIFSVSNQVVRNTLFRALKNLRKGSNALQSITVSPLVLLLLTLS